MDSTTTTNGDDGGMDDARWMNRLKDSTKADKFIKDVLHSMTPSNFVTCDDIMAVPSLRNLNKKQTLKTITAEVAEWLNTAIEKFRDQEQALTPDHKWSPAELKILAHRQVRIELLKLHNNKEEAANGSQSALPPPLPLTQSADTGDRTRYQVREGGAAVTGLTTPDHATSRRTIRASASENSVPRVLVLADAVTQIGKIMESNRVRVLAKVDVTYERLAQSNQNAERVMEIMDGLVGDMDRMSVEFNQVSQPLAGEQPLYPDPQAYMLWYCGDC